MLKVTNLRETDNITPLMLRAYIAKKMMSLMNEYSVICYGFKQHHVKQNISEIKTTDVRMKDENGFHVDVAYGDGEYTMIRVNVDDFDEVIEFFMSHGFRKPHHERAHKTVDTGSSRYTMVVSPSGYILAVSQHIK